MSNKHVDLFYSSESALRHPLNLFRTMIDYLLASWQLGLRLTIRDISAQYRQSLLGILWAFIPPILTTIVFVILNKYKVLNTGEINMPYPVYAFTGIILWQLFTDSLMTPLKIGRESRIMITKINFPHESLLISSVLQTLFSFAIKLMLLIILFFLYSVSISWTSIFFPIAVLGLILLGISLGVFLLPLSMLYNDISNAITMILGLWLFITPVIYMPSSTGLLGKITAFNPVTPVLLNSRDMLLNGTFAYFNGFILISLLCFFLLLAGWIIFRVSLPFIIERASA